MKIFLPLMIVALLFVGALTPTDCYQGQTCRGVMAGHTPLLVLLRSVQHPATQTEQAGETHQEQGVVGSAVSTTSEQIADPGTATPTATPYVDPGYPAPIEITPIAGYPAP